MCIQDLQILATVIVFLKKGDHAEIAYRNLIYPGANVKGQGHDR